MKMKIITLVICLSFCYIVFAEQASWKSQPSNSLSGLSEESIKLMLGLKRPFIRSPLLLQSAINEDKMNEKKLQEINLPKEFDAREQWKGMIHSVKEQGLCGACWAIAAADALADRFSISTMGIINANLSAEELLDCDTGNYGCAGGFLDTPWRFLENIGVRVEECIPYTAGLLRTPFNCTEPCRQLNGTLIPNGADKFDDPAFDRFYAWKNSAKFLLNNKRIMLELMTNGPVVMGFEVYSDFIKYSSGVYQKSKTANSTFIGGHAVKLIGWGTDNITGLDYWLIQNSWGTKWGENGYFRIRRGTNECNIEQVAVAGLPDLDRLGFKYTAMLTDHTNITTQTDHVKNDTNDIIKIPNSQFSSNETKIKFGQDYERCTECCQEGSCAKGYQCCHNGKELMVCCLRSSKCKNIVGHWACESTN